MILHLLAIDPDDAIYVAVDKIISIERVGKDTTRVYAEGARGWTLTEPIEAVLERLVGILNSSPDNA